MQYDRQRRERENSWVFRRTGSRCFRLALLGLALVGQAAYWLEAALCLPRVARLCCHSSCGLVPSEPCSPDDARRSRFAHAGSPPQIYKQTVTVRTKCRFSSGVWGGFRKCCAGRVHLFDMIEMPLSHSSFLFVTQCMHFSLVRSLLQQLQKLQSLISGKIVPHSCKMASTQTGTCLMVSFSCSLEPLLMHTGEREPLPGRWLMSGFCRWWLCVSSWYWAPSLPAFRPCPPSPRPLLCLRPPIPPPLNLFHQQTSTPLKVGR